MSDQPEDTPMRSLATPGYDGARSPTWTVVVATAVAALLADGVAGYFVHRPGVRERTRVVTRTVEVAPRSCADALDSTFSIADDAEKLAELAGDALTAVRALDLARLEALGDQALGLALKLSEVPPARPY